MTWKGNSTRVNIRPIFAILKLAAIFAAKSKIGHLFLKHSIHTHVYELHARATVDRYGNKLVGGNFLRAHGQVGEEERRGEDGIGVPRRMFGEIFYAFYGIIAYLRVDS